MKAVMRQLAQARRHYSTLPLFDLLRDDSRDPGHRIARAAGLGACLEAYERFERERGVDVERALRHFVVDVAIPHPLLATRLSRIVQPAPAERTWVIAESIAQTGRVLGAATVRGGGRTLVAAPDATVEGAAALEARVLDTSERSACLDTAFRVFDLFADWSNEVHSAACESLSRTAPPADAASRAALRAAG